MTKPDSSSYNHGVTAGQAKPFLIGIFGFFLFMGLILAIVAGLTMSWTHGTWPPSGPFRGPQSNPRWNNAAPQLQVDATLDLQHLRQEEYQRLHTVRWMDNAHTYASIPIDRAIDLLAQAQTNHQLQQLLPEAKPATPEELQNQKSREMPQTP